MLDHRVRCSAAAATASAIPRRSTKFAKLCLFEAMIAHCASGYGSDAVEIVPPEEPADGIAHMEAQQKFDPEHRRGRTRVRPAPAGAGHARPATPRIRRGWGKVARTKDFLRLPAGSSSTFTGKVLREGGRSGSAADVIIRGKRMIQCGHAAQLSERLGIRDAGFRGHDDDESGLLAREKGSRTNGRHDRDCASGTPSCAGGAKAAAAWAFRDSRFSGGWDGRCVVSADFVPRQRPAGPTLPNAGGRRLSR